MLFGTDGIRGEVVESPENDEFAVSQLLEERFISPRLLRLVGEALSRIVAAGSNVIIGWDNRPSNPDLVAALTTGLHLGGCKVTHGGVCATPALHNALLETGSALGCMITASHNPVTDSGIKVFDSAGFKISPGLEQEISELVIQLAAEEREVDLIHQQELSIPDSKYNADIACLIEEVDDPSQYGVVSGPLLEKGVIEINNMVEKPKKPKSKCALEGCNKKITIYNTPCKCKLIFCKKHTFFSDHNCTFDYKNNNKKILTISNPRVVGKSIEVI